MERNMKLGLVQMDCVMMDKKANLDKAQSYVEQAAGQGVDLICFPEMFSTGYNPDTIRERYFDLAEHPEGETFQRLSKLAAQHGMYIVAPLVLRGEVPGILYNGLIVIDRQGALMGVYNKTHLWAGERRYFRAGNEYPVFDCDFGKLGLMICYDGGFPEVARILALQGAELILCPSAFPIWDKDMWDLYFQARSLENACYVAGINRVGVEDNLDMFGNNKVYAPRGKLVAEAGVNREELLVCRLDMDLPARMRASEVPYLKDLRPSTYGRLVQEY